jgi:predicted ester cyclase
MTLADLPQLYAIEARWQMIRNECRAALRRVLMQSTSVALSQSLPLFPVVGDQVSIAGLVPSTMRLAERIGGVRAAAVSVLGPGRRETPATPALRGTKVAMLCLDGGAHGHVIVDGARLDLADGRIVVFDAAASRANVNDGAGDRLALWLLVDATVVDEPFEKRLARRVMWQILDGGGIAAADELMTPACAALVTSVARTFHASFADLAFELDYVVHEGPTVACSWRVSGTQHETFFNIPATGARVRWSGSLFLRIEAGQICAAKILWDMLGVLQQLRGALAERPELPRWIAAKQAP